MDERVYAFVALSGLGGNSSHSRPKLVFGQNPVRGEEEASEQMVRRIAAVALAALVTVTLAACGSSSGTHTQSYLPSPTVSAITTSSVPASASVSDPKSPTSIRPSTQPVSTPTVAPGGQSAVNTYIAFYNAINAADRDPAHANLASINRYLAGKAMTLFDGVITNQAKAHLAYRGTPDNPRLRVSEIISPSFLFLASCPKRSSSDPSVQYDVRTGKAVTVKGPAPNVERLISMKRYSSGWKVFDFIMGNKKCAP